jgi:hypothetical protein
MCVREQRLGTKHVLGEYFAGRGENRAVTATGNERRAHLALERREMLGHRGLTDVELLGGGGQGAAARDRRERPDLRLEVHHCKL